VYKDAVGECWWLFDTGRPYLAEVFKDGTLPEGRFPHMDKRRFQGKTIARVLGQQRQIIKTVAPKARTYKFSTWCDTWLSAFYSRSSCKHICITCNHITSGSICRTTTAAEVMEQAGLKVLSRRGTACAAGAEDARHEAAAMHYLRTGEEVINIRATTVEAVIQMLQAEAQGTSACGDCCSCVAGEDCKRASNRWASRRGKPWAILAEEAEQLVGREFEVCSLRCRLEIACWCMLFL
jgi:hypothetical protein